MKKYILRLTSFILAILFLLLTGGCLNIKGEPIVENLIEIDKEQQEQENISEEIEEEEIIRDPIELLQYEGLTQISGNKNAAYFVRAIPERHLLKYQPDFIRENNYQFFTISYLMTYVTDFDTVTTRPLCSIENCTHETPECEAWIESSHGNISLLAGKDKLFYINAMYRSEQEVGIEPNTYHRQEEFSYIDMIDLDGSNKTRIYTANKEETIDSNYLLYDGTNLTFFVDGREYNYLDRCITIDINTLEVVLEYQLPFEGKNMNDIRPVGIYNNKPLFAYNSYVLPMNGPNSVVTETNVTVFTLDTLTGNRTDYMLITSNNDTKYWYTGRIWTGSSFLEFDEEDRVIVEVGLDYKEHIIPIDKSINERNPQPWELYGTKLLLFYSSPAEPYYLDILTGELTEFTLIRRTYIGEKWPVMIVAESEDEFLVLTGVTDDFISDSPVKFYDYVRGWGGGQFTYAMISKDDYFNCIPNYRTVGFSL